jgi:hypothetical protein
LTVTAVALLADSGEPATAEFGLDVTAVLQVLGPNMSGSYALPIPAVLGRTDPLVAPEVFDLTALGAQQRGVSRRHCRLYRQGRTLMVTDLGSTNGTYLNDVRLPAHQACVVADGDSLRLGALRLSIAFSKLPANSDTTPATAASEGVRKPRHGPRPTNH